MKSVYNFVVEPLKSRYNNTKSIGDKELILNTEIFNHQHVSREAVVKEIPTIGHTDIQVGDIVIVHHNVFRRWHDVKGVERNSRSYFDENTYLISSDQIFLYKNNNVWKSQKDYCFVKPVVSTDKYGTNKEKPLVGIVEHGNDTVKKGDLIGFRPDSEYEFIIDGKKLYRVLSNFITIKYEYQGDEKEYNPSWA
jgi:hypothetical protein|tara:strand:- start:401 stop:982 length:582 start_codon:yes stop_codon:yes gene_type:complete